MNRYILEESRMSDGRLMPICIMYVGEVLESLTFEQIRTDRQKVFGKNWSDCLSSGDDEILKFTLSRFAHRRLCKSELR